MQFCIPNPSSSMASPPLSQHPRATVCLQCGDEGFKDLLVYCRNCGDSALHAYCMKVITPDDDNIKWWCWDCKDDINETDRLDVDGDGLETNLANERQRDILEKEKPVPEIVSNSERNELIIIPDEQEDMVKSFDEIQAIPESGNNEKMLVVMDSDNAQNDDGKDVDLLAADNNPSAPDTLCIYRQPYLEPHDSSIIGEPDIAPIWRMHDMPVGRKRNVIRNPKERTKRRHDSDDDFVDDTQPKRIKLKQKRVRRRLKENASKKAANMRELYASYPMLSSRCSPWGIFTLLKDLNERQREDVKELGFGNILDLTIKELPSRLAHWVVENFDVQSCELKLQNGRRIEITDQDVHLVLGFPVGGRRILPIEQQENESSVVYEEWKSLFSEIADKEKILQKHVVQLIKNEQEGGAWFKRHFVVLLASCLMETTTHGYVSPNFMHCLEDVTTVNQWNWSEFVIACLIRSRRAWADKSQKFCGPALFLLVLYVDRVRVLNKIVPRKFPSFINWDYARLKERQDEEIRTGGFGGGLLLNPISVNVDGVADKCINTSEVTGVNVDNVIRGNSSKSEQPLEPETVDAIRYSKDIITKSNLIGKQIVDLLNMIENVPPSVADTIYFNKSVKTACSLIGNKIFSEDSHGNTQPANSITQMYEDDIWGNDDVLKCLFEIEAAQIKIIEFLKRTDDRPSYSTGMTQLFNGEKAGFNDDQSNGDGAGIIEETHLHTETRENELSKDINVNSDTILTELEHHDGSCESTSGAVGMVEDQEKHAQRETAESSKDFNLPTEFEALDGACENVVGVDLMGLEANLANERRRDILEKEKPVPEIVSKLPDEIHASGNNEKILVVMDAQNDDGKDVHLLAAHNLPSAPHTFCRLHPYLDSVSIAPIWRGCFNYIKAESEVIFIEILGHLSNKACSKVCDAAAKAVPPILDLQLVDKHAALPKKFRATPPTAASIGLYFIPARERDETLYDSLFEEVIERDLALKVMIGMNLQLLIFSSHELSSPLRNCRYKSKSKTFLWGMFKKMQSYATVGTEPNARVEK